MRPRSSRSPTARSPRRSTSRSGSSPPTHSVSRRSCCSVAGIFFLIVSLSYAEGTAALPETGGAATFVRRAFNDVFGFLTGWALFLDYLIVIALSTLFLPHYLGTALGIGELRESPWDIVIAVTRDPRDRRRSARPPLADPYGGIVVAGLDLATQLLLVILGLALLFSPDALTQGTDLGLADLGRPGLRPAAGDARLYGPRDGRQPRRGDPRAGPDAAAEPLLGDRARRRDHGRGRDRRPRRLPGRERPDGARRGMAEGAARGHRRGTRGDTSPTSSATRSSSTSASPVRSSCSRRRRRRCPASRGWRTRSAATASSRPASGGSTAARSSRPRRSSP